MKSRNPAVIPRNHKVEEALEAANIGNLKPFEDLVSILKEPYTERAALKAYKRTIEIRGSRLQDVLWHVSI